MKIKFFTIGLLTSLIVFASCSNESQKKQVDKQPLQEEQQVELSEEQKKYENLKVNYELDGAWVINNGLTNSSYEYEIYSNSDGIIGVMKFEKMNFETLTKNGNKYEVEGNSYGEYYIIDQNNNMKLFDQDGDLTSAGYTAKKK